MIERDILLAKRQDELEKKMAFILKQITDIQSRQDNLIRRMVEQEILL